MQSSKQEKVFFMAHISVEKSGVRSEFRLNDKQKPSIEFIDPSYARANAVLLDPKSKGVHVLLHEGVFLIGNASDNFFETLMQSDDIELCANLPNGERVSLQAPVSLLNDLKEVIKCEEGNDNGEFPTYAAGGYAVTALS